MLEPLPNNDLIKCPNCAELIRRDAILCRFCDTGLSTEFFQPCTFCAELIRKEATICRFCRSKLPNSSLFNLGDATIDKLFQELSVEETIADVRAQPRNPLEGKKNDISDKGKKSPDSIKGLDSVRHRPGMYIGSTGPRGLHHLVWEIVDNSINEVLAGYCKNIFVTVNPDNSVTVKDDGRGIQTGPIAKTGTSYVETVFTVLHAGGKFSSESYKISGGLHGVGASVVNALSSRLEVEVYRDGNIYKQVYLQGKPESGLEVIGKTDLHGTKVTFWPDDEIFCEINKDQERVKIAVEWNVLTTYLRRMSFLNKGLAITLSDTREPEIKTTVFCYANGIADYVEHLNETLNPLHSPPIYFEQKEGNIIVECALQWTAALTENIYSFANNINTHDGGTHLMGFYHALTMGINRYARKQGLLNEGEDHLNDQDIREGLTAIISIKLPEPQFEGQTKERLGNREVQKQTELIVSIGLMRWLDHNPESAEKVISKCIQTAKRKKSST